MKLRQLVFVCKDLESNAKELCETLGIEISPMLLATADEILE